MGYYNNYSYSNPTGKQRRFFRLVSRKCLELGITPEPMPGTRQGFDNAIRKMTDKLLKKGLDYSDLTIEKLSYLDGLQ